MAAPGRRNSLGGKDGAPGRRNSVASSLEGLSGGGNLDGGRHERTVLGESGILDQVSMEGTASNCPGLLLSDESGAISTVAVAPRRSCTRYADANRNSAGSDKSLLGSCRSSAGNDVSGSDSFRNSTSSTTGDQCRSCSETDIARSDNAGASGGESCISGGVMQDEPVAAETENFSLSSVQHEHEQVQDIVRPHRCMSEVEEEDEDEPEA